MLYDWFAERIGHKGDDAEVFFTTTLLAITSLVLGYVLLKGADNAAMIGISLIFGLSLAATRVTCAWFVSPPEVPLETLQQKQKQLVVRVKFHWAIAAGMLAYTLMFVTMPLTEAALKTLALPFGYSLFMVGFAAEWGVTFFKYDAKIKSLSTLDQSTKRSD